jgi:FkbM family methyltransferase
MIKDLARRLTPRWLWSRLRTWKQHRTMAGFVPYTVEHTYAGLRLKVHIADPMAQGWYDHEWGKLVEIELLRAGRLRQGARVFDLGAHQGLVAMLLAHEVGATGQVVAIEALPHNAHVCRVNQELNGTAHVLVEAAAVAERPGQVDVCIDLNAQLKTSRTNIATVRVPAVTVDELTERYGPPDVLFVDVEGYECQVLRGAARTLNRRPDCFLEVHGGCGLEQFGGSVAELFAHLPTAAYDFLAWSEDARAPVAVAGAAECPPGRFFLVARAHA